MTDNPFSKSDREETLSSRGIHTSMEEMDLLKKESLKLQKHLESVNQELAQKKASLSTLLKTVSEGVLFLDLEGTITEFNKAAENLLSIPSSKALFQKFWDLFEDHFFGFSMKEALRFGISWRHLFLKGLEISTSFLYEGPKQHHGMYLIFKDISEKEKLLQSLTRNERMLELGKVALTVAHEIRNPLGGIRGYASLLFQDLKNNTYLQEMAGLILEGTKSLEKIVHGILHYSKPVHVEIQTLDICLFLRQLAKFIKMDPALGKQIRFSLHVPDEPLLVPFDSSSLKAALLNLIFNAIQAMPQGGELTLFAMQQGPSCQISVSDTGVGMTDEQKERLFSPFFTTKQGGNGIGLVEVQKIVQAHMGTLEVRSQLRKGTTFTIYLPLRK